MATVQSSPTVVREVFEVEEELEELVESPRIRSRTKRKRRTSFTITPSSVPSHTPSVNSSPSVARCVSTETITPPENHIPQSYSVTILRNLLSLSIFYDSYFLGHLARFSDIETLIPGYIWNKKFAQRAFTSLSILYYVCFYKYGTDYKIVSTVTNIMALLATLTFWYVTPNIRATYVKWLAIVVNSYNISSLFVRVYISNSAYWAIVSASMSSITLGWLPYRRINIVHTTIGLHLIVLVLVLHLYIQFNEWYSGCAIGVMFLCLCHFLGDIDFTMRCKCKILETFGKELKSAVQMKNEFISNVSHELRNPLLGISGSLELLQSTALTTEQERHIETIASCSSILQSLIEDILQFAKVGHKTYMTVSHNFSLRQCIGTMESIATAYAKKLNIHISIRVEDSVPDRLRGDSRILQQLLLNIITNAVKASPENGTVILSVKLDSSSTPNSMSKIMLKFSVEDRGPGIPVEKQHLLFLPYSQLDNIPDRMPSTGLGLAICKKLAEAINAEICLRSNTDHETHGTIVSVIAPYKVIDGISVVNPSDDMASLMMKSKERYLKSYSHCERDVNIVNYTEEPTEKKNNNSLKVAIAEDNLINKTVLIRLLKKFEFRVVVAASDGQELLDKLAEIQDTDQFPDVVITDYHMPKKNGSDVAIYIRNSFPGTKIILLTGNDVTEGVGELVDQILLKPVKAKELVASIHSILGSK